MLINVVEHRHLNNAGSFDYVLLVLVDLYDGLVERPVNVADQQVVRGLALLVSVDLILQSVIFYLVEQKNHEVCVTLENLERR